jgi:hypothetical protein
VEAVDVEIISDKRKLVVVTLTAGTDLTNLSLQITYSGANIVPHASGVTQDFYKSGFTPVVYTVTAEDGSTATWTVIARLTPLAPTPTSPPTSPAP